MKKLLILIALVAIGGHLWAQDRVINMPEAPEKGYNVAEVDNGFWLSFDIGGGYTVMEGRDNVGMVGASGVGGYRFNEYLKVGAGLGILYYPNGTKVRSTKNHIGMPLFINARGNFLSGLTRQTVPYWSINLGTTIPDGFFLTPSLGLRIGEKRGAFLVNAGYTIRHLKTEPGHKSGYSGVLLKVGYEF